MANEAVMSFMLPRLVQADVRLTETGLSQAEPRPRMGAANGEALRRAGPPNYFIEHLNFIHTEVP